MSDNFFLLAFTQFAIYNVIIVSLYIILSRNFLKSIIIIAYGLLLFSFDAFREFLYVFGTKMGLRSEIEEYLHFTLVLPIALLWSLNSEKNKNYTIPKYFILIVFLELFFTIFFKLKLIPVTSFLNKYIPIFINIIGLGILSNLLIKSDTSDYFNKFLKTLIKISFLIFGFKFLFDVLAFLVLTFKKQPYYKYFFDAYLIFFLLKCLLLLCIGMVTLMALKKFKFKLKDNSIKENIDKQLLDVIEEENYFTDKELTIEKLAYLLKTDTKQLRNSIKIHKEMNYNDYINSLRLQYFLNNLSEAELEKTTILGIAENAGFKSKSTFNRVFKEKFNCTPSQYIQKHLKST